MARTSKIVLDVDFGELDEAKIKELSKRIGEKFRKEPIDLNWTQAQKSILSIKKQIEDVESNREKVAKKIGSIEDKIRANQEKYRDIQGKISDAQFKLDKEVERFEKRKETANEKIRDSELKMMDLKDKDDDKSKLRFDKTNTDKMQALKELELITLEQSKLEKDASESNLDFLKDEQSQRELIDALQEEKNKTLGDANDIEDKYNKMLDDEVAQTTVLKDLQRERAEMVSAIATQMKKSNKALTDNEALRRAKLYVSYDDKQTKFEKKHWDMLQKTKKYRKEELKDRTKELKLHQAILAGQNVGWLQRHKVFREEQKRLKQELGFKKPGIGGRIGEKIAPKAIAAEQGAQLMGVVGKLAGPLLALGGLAGIIMTILKFNKEVAEARKQLFILGATGSDAWNKIESGQLAGAKATDGYIKTLHSMWDRVGMKYEEALQNVGALTNAGIKLDDVMQHNAKTFVEVEHMAVLSGKTFGEMAAISGEWVTEMNKRTDQLMTTFTEMRHDAAVAGVTTTRFFSSVMNAAQGLAVYGDDVDKVSAAFRDLMKHSKMPQKEAEQFATTLLTAVDSMTTSQKALVAQQSIAAKIEALKARIAKADELQQRGQVVDAKLLSKQRKEAADELEKLNKIATSRDLNKLVTSFEQLAPGGRVTAQFQALAESLKGASGNLGDIFRGQGTLAEKFTKALSGYGVQMEDMLKEFGIAVKRPELLDYLKKGGLLEGLGKELTEREQKDLKARERTQAGIIEQGTKPILDTITETIGKWLSEIYMQVEKLATAVIDWIGQDYKKSLKLEDETVKMLGDLGEERAKIKQEMIDLSTKKTLTPVMKTQLEKDQRRLEEIDKSMSLLKEKKATVEQIKKQTSGITGGFMNWAKKGIAPEAAAAPKLAAVESSIKSEQLKQLTGAAPEISGTVTSPAFNIASSQKDKADAKKMLIDELERQAQMSAQLTGSKMTWKNIWTDEKDKLLKQLYGFGLFARGGYTGQGPQSDIAGMVHNKEFVFDAASTKKIGPTNLATLMNAIKTVPTVKPIDASKFSAAAVPAAAGSNIRNNTVTIQVNQRDRQEIEQIVYKVLYGEKRAGY